MQQANLMKLWPSCPDCNTAFSLSVCPSSLSIISFFFFFSLRQRLSFFLSLSASLSFFSFSQFQERGREAPRIFPSSLFQELECATQAVCVFVSFHALSDPSTVPSSCFSHFVHVNLLPLSRSQYPFLLGATEGHHLYFSHAGTAPSVFSFPSLHSVLSYSVPLILRLVPHSCPPV